MANLLLFSFALNISFLIGKLLNINSSNLILILASNCFKIKGETEIILDLVCIALLSSGAGFSSLLVTFFDLIFFGALTFKYPSRFNLLIAKLIWDGKTI